MDGRRALKTLLAANKRLNTAYLLKESFGQLWSYDREGWARRFFENWRAALKWHRLTPYEKFAAMIEQHWDGIAAYCRAENKVALGFVEGLNNKVRVLQRRAYGLRDEEYLLLKILTCMLPALCQRRRTQTGLKSPTRFHEEPENGLAAFASAKPSSSIVARGDSNARPPPSEGGALFHLSYGTTFNW